MIWWDWAQGGGVRLANVQMDGYSGQNTRGKYAVKVPSSGQSWSMCPSASMWCGVRFLLQYSMVGLRAM